MAGTTTVGQDLLRLLLKIAVITGCFALLFSFVFGLVRAPDDTMAPNIKEGDLVLYYRLDKRYQSDDLVVLARDGKPQIRRVAAVAGDTVDIGTEGGVSVNGVPPTEKYITGKTYRFQQGIAFPATVAPDQVFLLGDDREHCTDSRIYGMVQKEETKGKVIGLFRRRNL